MTMLDAHEPVVAAARKRGRMTSFASRIKLSRLEATLRRSQERTLLEDEDVFSGRVEALSEMQKIVLQFLAQGRSNKRIAIDCDVAEATVKAHVTEILRRLELGSRTSAAVQYAVLIERRRNKDIELPSPQPEREADPIAGSALGNVGDERPGRSPK